MGGIIRGEQCDGRTQVTLDGDPLPWGAAAWDRYGHKFHGGSSRGNTLP